MLNLSCPRGARTPTCNGASALGLFSPIKSLCCMEYSRTRQGFVAFILHLRVNLKGSTSSWAPINPDVSWVYYPWTWTWSWVALLIPSSWFNAASAHVGSVTTNIEPSSWRLQYKLEAIGVGSGSGWRQPWMELKVSEIQHWTPHVCSITVQMLNSSFDLHMYSMCVPDIWPRGVGTYQSAAALESRSAN